MKVGKNTSLFMSVSFAWSFRGYKPNWSLPGRARDALDHIEDSWNEESADERFRYHTANYRRAHNLACYRTCSGRGPERDAAENKGERRHHEGPEAKPRRGECCIDDRHTAFIILLRKRDDQNRIFRSQADEHHQTDLGVD